MSRAIDGPDAADFQLAAGGTCAGSLAPGGTCTIRVTFRPNAPGNRQARLTITDNAAGSPHQVPLTGRGCSVLLTVPGLPPVCL
jgi:hypothetical protein